MHMMIRFGKKSDDLGYWHSHLTSLNQNRSLNDNIPIGNFLKGIIF